MRRKNLTLDLGPGGFDFLAIEFFTIKAVVNQLCKPPEAILFRIFSLHGLFVDMRPVVHKGSIAFSLPHPVLDLEAADFTGNILG